MSGDETAIREVIALWDAAWNSHDATALANLHQQEAETVNRFGSFLQGRERHEEQFIWLHSGPFAKRQSPAQEVLNLRFLRPDVALVHTSWGTPVLEIEGQKTPAEEMIVSYVLTKESGDWSIAAVDLHNIDSPAGLTAMPKTRSGPLDRGSYQLSAISYQLSFETLAAGLWQWLLAIRGAG